jgi:hypothetical protein
MNFKGQFLKITLSLLISFSTESIISLKGQSLEDQMKQVENISKFYQSFSNQYAKDLFTSVYPAQSFMVFHGTQMYAPSAFSLELRTGVSARLPQSVIGDHYSNLDTAPNIENQIIYGSNLLQFKPNSELFEPEEKLFFQLEDPNGKPFNGPTNFQDSIRWRIPSLSQLGLTEAIAPRTMVLLRFAPGYAFELAGTYLLYNSAPLNDRGLATSNRTRFYMMHIAHDMLYWLQKYHYMGWHVTANFTLSNWNQSINLTPDALNYQDFNFRGNRVWFNQQFERIDLFNRSIQYGLNVGKSFRRGEVWAGITSLTNFGALSDAGFVSAYFDNDNDNENGFKVRRYRGMFGSGVINSQFINFGIGASLGQKSIRYGFQYNMLSNGTHQASAMVKYVFYDNLRHPWQMKKDEMEYFNPNVRQQIKKTVIMVREEE